MSKFPTLNFPRILQPSQWCPEASTDYFLEDFKTMGSHSLGQRRENWGSLRNLKMTQRGFITTSLHFVASQNWRNLYLFFFVFKRLVFNSGGSFFFFFTIMPTIHRIKHLIPCLLWPWGKNPRKNLMIFAIFLYHFVIC